jgi:hypothetical protein
MAQEGGGNSKAMPNDTKKKTGVPRCTYNLFMQHQYPAPGYKDCCAGLSGFGNLNAAQDELFFKIKSRLSKCMIKNNSSNEKNSVT